MIVTVTPNPSRDRAYDLVGLARGEVNRAEDVHHDAGGKGINVSRALVALGVPTVAVLPAGGHVGTRLVGMLQDVGVDVRPVPTRGETRTNVTLAESDGTTTKVNAPGPRLRADEVAALVGAVEAVLARGPEHVVAAGSLPPGADDLYPRLGALLADTGVPFVADTSGAALRAVVELAPPALVKPNDEELAELVGRPLATVGDVEKAARELLDRGVGQVLVSLGRHGAVLVTPAEAIWAGAPPVRPLSTVGAGDTALAAFLATAGAPADRLRAAVAWGRAAVLSPGSAVPSPHDVDLRAVRVVHRPDPAQPLEELRP